IDGAHMVVEWGDTFCKDFANLWQLRFLLPQNSPLFTTSATIESTELRIMEEWLFFHPNSKMIRISPDHPTISYNVQSVKHAKNLLRNEIDLD
ncbi:hypothetical protein L873DRAFT_1665344, partial [Choiromyces venosus 120613-1]